MCNSGLNKPCKTPAYFANMTKKNPKFRTFHTSPYFYFHFYCETQYRRRCSYVRTYTHLYERSQAHPIPSISISFRSSCFICNSNSALYSPFNELFFSPTSEWPYRCPLFFFAFLPEQCRRSRRTQVALD
jgi:hypothetical protein